MKPLLAALAGLLPALLAMYLALFLGGGGHGWTAPFFHSFLLFAAWPLVCAGLASRGRRRWGFCRLVLMGAVVWDLTLALLTLAEWDWFLRALDVAPWAAWGWLALWVGVQAGALGVLLARRRELAEVDWGSSPE
jgi:hypothetical protein